MGRRVGRVLLYPICGYFFLFARRARRSSAEYLSLALGRPATRRDQFRHLYTFASMVLDRPFLLTGRATQIQARIHGADALLARVRQKQGCILLSAHLGSFEALRVLGRDLGEIPLRVLMYEQNARKVSGILHTLNPNMAHTIIPVGKPDSLFHVDESVQRGESIGILGDRVWSHERTAAVPFFGRPMRLPTGPWMMAHLVGAPVFLVFALMNDDGTYEIHIESFLERVELPRQSRADGSTALAARFAGRLEHYCRRYPYNWFNFYDIWDENRH
jgi:predicted LPLAT superfamily acyltransferase